MVTFSYNMMKMCPRWDSNPNLLLSALKPQGTVLSKLHHEGAIRILLTLIV